MVDSGSACPTLAVIAPASQALPPGSMLNRTAAVHAVMLSTPRMPHKDLGARRSVIAQALENLANRSCWNTLAMCVDAYDTFLRCDPKEIQKRFAAAGVRVLISAERQFSFAGDTRERQFYDHLSVTDTGSRTGILTAYRFLNVGGMMGSVRNLLSFVRASMQQATRPGQPSTSAWADQFPVSQLFAHVHRTVEARLDYNSSVFYVASGIDLDEHGLGAMKRVRAANPCMVHVPGTSSKGSHAYKAQTILRLLFARVQTRRRDS